MNYFKSHKIAIFLIIGFTIAMLTRASFFVVTTDLTYYRIGILPIYPTPNEFDEKHLGKEVIGLSGFPFQTYSDCTMGYHGTLVSPACNSYSINGEFSIVINTIFWTIIFYSIFTIYSIIINSTYSKG